MTANSLNRCLENGDHYSIAKRYQEQVAATSHALQQWKEDSRIGPLWEVIHTAGKGLPQEFFHSRSI